MATGTVANAKKPSNRLYKTLTGQLSVQLKFKRATKRNTQFPGLRLPFTDTEQPGAANFWAMPETEGYVSGRELGQYAVAAYLRAVRSAPGHCHGLASVVQSIVESNGGKLSTSQQGALVGFFGTVDGWLRFAVAAAGQQLESFTDAELEWRMSYAASMSPEQAKDRVRESAKKAGLELEP